jgi:hypothetical protein
MAPERTTQVLLHLGNWRLFDFFGVEQENRTKQHRQSTSIAVLPPFAHVVCYCWLELPFRFLDHYHY